MCILKQERDEIINHKYRGAVIRSKLPISQEKPTKCFLSIESGIQKSRLVTEINDFKLSKKATTKHFKISITECL